MKKNLFIVISSVLVSLALSSCNETNKLDKEVSLIFTSNIQGHLLEDSNEECFGYDGLASYRSKRLELTPYVSLIDLGNFSSGNAKVEESKGALTIEIMNKVHYDYALLQDQEFSYGLDNISSLIKKANMTFLASNLKYVGNEIDKLSEVKNYVIINYGGIKVGLYSLMSSSFMNKYDSSEYLDENGNYIYSLFNDNLDEFYNDVQKTINDMRSNGAQYIIVLSTLNETSPVSLTDVISKTTSIDAAIDGGSLISFASQSVNNKNNEVVYISAPGKDFTSISEITISRAGSITLTSINGYKDKNSLITKFIKDKLA